MHRLLPAILLALPSLAFAQGQLTPPDGAIGPRGPVPTMKTLDQVEPRTPLRAGSAGVTQNANGGFTISASGSYYLEDNLSVASDTAISLNTGDVTLDLNGFTIASSAAPGSASGFGINVNGQRTNIAIRNGHIRGTTTYNGSTETFTTGGFICGISSLGQGTRVTGVSVVGIAGDGISLGNEGSIISDCTVSTCAGCGLVSDTVNDATATTCGAYPISANTVANCRASVVSANGPYPAISAKSVTNSFATASAGEGIRATIVINSIGTSTSRYGILATDTATNSSGTSSISTGLRATIATGCEGRSSSGIGLEASQSATGCFGTTDTGSYGLDASSGTATNCIGKNHSGTGLSAEVATGCYGTSTSGIGLQAAQNATGSTGITATGSTGLLVGDTSAAGTAENCRGIVTGGTGTGLSAETAANCFGQSTAGTGLIAATATNCSAYTASGSIAMSVAGTANSCRGNNGKAGGIAIQAAIAVSCTSAGGTISATNKYNMP